MIKQCCKKDHLAVSVLIRYRMPGLFSRKKESRQVLNVLPEMFFY
jgi:hypothetical protein